MMNSVKKPCKYADNCYRLNYDHFIQYCHPHLEALVNNTSGDVTNLPSDFVPKIKRETIILQLELIKELSRQIPIKETPVGQSSNNCSAEKNRNKKKIKIDMAVRKCSIDLATRLKCSEPYGLFLSAIESEPETYNENLTVTFQDLLSKDLGELSDSLQINYTIDIGWLLAQYYFTGNNGKPITLIYGQRDEEIEELMRKKKLPHVSAVNVIPPTLYGHHHAKLMILSYKDGSMRIVLPTGNLIELEWINRTQGIWISPKLPPINLELDDDSGMDSPTHFKSDLLRYLKFYKLDVLQPWINKIKNVDFTGVKVFLIPSVPGSFSDEECNMWGHRYLRKLLKTHVTFSPSDNPMAHSLIYQCSSIGSLGMTESQWFSDQFTKTISSSSDTDNILSNICLVYPTFKNVDEGHGKYVTAACLPYSFIAHQKQMWLNPYFRQWKSNDRHRSRAVPHTKTYCRLSSCNKFVHWYVLTSANLSKAAWGKNTSTGKLQILSYELGILFLPQFLNGDKVFDISAGNQQSFHLPYDVPVVEYGEDDIPWSADIVNINI